MAVTNNKLFFAGLEGTSNQNVGLYSWSGIDGDTVRLVYRAMPNSGDPNIQCMVGIGTKVYFNAYTNAEGMEVHVYDDATHTGHIVADLSPGDTNPRDFYVFNNKVYFIAWDYKVRCIDPSNDSIYVAATFNTFQPGGFATVGNKMYLSGMQGLSTTYGFEIYSLDTANVLTRLTDIKPAYRNSVLYDVYHEPCIGVLDSALYFMAPDSDAGYGQELWKYDIATSTPTMITRMNTTPTQYARRPARFITYRNNLYFTGDDGTHGTELWRYDGVGQPYMVQDLYPGSGFGEPKYMNVFDGSLYFTTSGIRGELYKFTDTSVQVAEPFADTVLCGGQVFNLHYTSDTFGSSNIFIAQLSDASGSFASPLYLGSVTATTSGTISCTLPSAVAVGSGYRLRIISTSPVFTSRSETVPIRVTATQVPSVTLAASPGTVVPLPTTSVTFTATPVNGGTTPVYNWTKNGSPIAGASTNVYSNNSWVNNDNVCVIMTSNLSCAVPTTATSCKTITYTGVENVSSWGDMNIYPNPNKGDFMLTGKLSGPAHINIAVTDINGKTVYSDELTSATGKVNKLISIKGIAPGVYLVHLTGDNGKRVMKLVVSER
jgi:ELWxxDGT repeat protein